MKCHAGLQYARGRIELRGKLTGVQIAGQFYLAPPDEKEEAERINALAEKHGINADDLMDTARQMRQLNEGNQAQIGQWLKRLAETFETIGGEFLLQSITTDADGQFSFAELAPGDYCVYPDLAPTCGGYAGNNPTTSISREVSLEPGGIVDLVWFGYATRGAD